MAGAQRIFSNRVFEFAPIINDETLNAAEASFSVVGMLSAAPHPVLSRGPTLKTLVTHCREEELGPYEQERWAQTRRTGSVSSKVVLLYLAQRSDELGSGFPGQKKIAEETEQSERTIRTRLAELEQQGFMCRQKRLREDGRGRTSDRFFLHVDGLCAAENCPLKATEREDEFPASSAGRTDCVIDQAAMREVPSGKLLPDREQPGVALTSYLTTREETNPKDTPPTPPSPQGTNRVPTPSQPLSAADAADVDSERTELVELCSLMADLIVANGSKRPVITKRWLDACRLMINVDGRTVEQIQTLIRWSQADEFWMANCLSMPTLRKQFDRLRIKRNSELTPRGSSQNKSARAWGGAGLVALMEYEEEQRRLANEGASE